MLVNHRGITPGDFWAPPGGGLDLGESVLECLTREMKEETGLDVKVGDFLFVTEFINKPLHAVELFFRTEAIGGILRQGFDPEMGDHQIIKEVKIISWPEIDALDKASIHGIFKNVQNSREILDLRGYFKL